MKDTEPPDILIQFIILVLGALAWLWVGWSIYHTWLSKPPQGQIEREYSEFILVGDSLKASAPVNHISPQVLGIMIDYNGKERTWNTNVAYAVMMAESHGNPNNINWRDYHRYGNCWGSFGLFQLACFRGTQEQLLDPETNIQMAYELWKREGWRPWGAYTNNSYKRFLK